MQISQRTFEVSRSFRDATIDFVWRQWSQLGLSAAVEGRDTWSMDPEALLIYSLHIARRDPRLFDELLDWVVHNASLLSVQRLRNLSGPDDRELLRASMAWAAEHGAVVLKSFMGALLGDHTRQEDLFLVDGGRLYVEVPDPVFARFGFARPKARLSGKSRAPTALLPASVAIRLRLMFGVGSRAEVLRYLLTSGTTAPTSRVAEVAGYARRNVSEALSDLSSAGLIVATHRGRRRFWRADLELWGHLLRASSSAFPVFVDWIPLLRAARRLQNALDEAATSVRTEYIHASLARTLLDEVRNDLEGAGIRVARPLSVEDAPQALERTIDNLGEFLRFPGTGLSDARESPQPHAT